jgi:hypothetical protein
MNSTDVAIDVVHGFNDKRDTPFATLCHFGRAHPSFVGLTCGEHTEIWVSVKCNGQPADQDAMDAARAECTQASFSPYVTSIAPGFFEGFGVLRDVSVSPKTRVTEESFRGCPSLPREALDQLLGGARVR